VTLRSDGGRRQAGVLLEAGDPLAHLAMLSAVLAEQQVVEA
jgi:hypothetical protein